MKFIFVILLLVPFLAAVFLSLKFKSPVLRIAVSSIVPGIIFFFAAFSVADSILSSINPVALESIPHQSAFQNATEIGFGASIFGAILGMAAHFVWPQRTR